MKMIMAAELGYFIIKYIEKYELDMLVGLENKDDSIYRHPQIHFIPNDGVDYGATNELLEDLQQKTLHRLDKLNILEYLKTS